MAEPLFNFRLRDLSDVQPWTDSDGSSFLSWYGLSDGWYWLKCGEDELFRATPEIMAHWKVPSDTCYCDYQVAKLWEDILHMLPEVLNPVPGDLEKYISNFGGEAEWESRCTVWVNSDAGFEDFGSSCLDWVNRRRLDSLYLQQGPIIRLWRFEDQIRVHWDNTECKLDGVSVWTSLEGHQDMPVGEFLQEVRSFNDRFISEMSLRVRSVAANWNRPAVRVDVNQLLATQEECSGALAKALSSKPETKWDEVRIADRILTEKLRANPAHH